MQLTPFNYSYLANLCLLLVSTTCVSFNRSFCTGIKDVIQYLYPYSLVLVQPEHKSEIWNWVFRMGNHKNLGSFIFNGDKLQFIQMTMIDMSLLTVKSILLLSNILEVLFKWNYLVEIDSFRNSWPCHLKILMCNCQGFWCLDDTWTPCWLRFWALYFSRDGTSVQRVVSGTYPGPAQLVS